MDKKHTYDELINLMADYLEDECYVNGYKSIHEASEQIADDLNTELQNRYHDRSKQDRAIDDAMDIIINEARGK